MNGWLPIESAPKDGRVILLTAFEDDGSTFEIHAMQWAHIQRNGMFPERVGMWTAPDGDYTWNDDGFGGGPTHWQPVEAYRDALERAASAIEARSGGTPKSGPTEGESAGAKPDAQGTAA